MKKSLKRLIEFTNVESAGGLILLGAAVVAMVLANSPFAEIYRQFNAFPIVIGAGGLVLDKPLLLWINDGLMAVFFLLVGLEIKRELIEGQLSSPAKAALPAIAALGGVILPAVIFVAFNAGEPANLRGWAIPTATDIAFALGILALAGPAVPVSLKVFLTALAILDDLVAIVIIAAFYAGDLNMDALGIASAATLALLTLNALGMRRLAPYLLIGVVLWVAVLKSGIHATIAGVVLAFTIPLGPAPKGEEDGGGDGEGPLHQLEHAILPWSTFGIMPLFAFVNAGVSFAGLTPAALLAPLPFGIAVGLFLGKPIGITAFAWAAVRLRLGALPEGASWIQLHGVAMLGGVGFTMSLFIGSLAFPDAASAVATRLGVLGGSAASALLGYAVLRMAVVGPAAESVKMNR